MRSRSWSKTLREFSRNLEDTWDDLIHDDTSQVEREFNRLIGRLQRRHGYSPDRALNELQHQWNTYSKRTQSIIEKQMDSLPIHRKQKATRWPWILGAIVGVAYLGFTFLRQTDTGQSKHSRNGYQASKRTGTTSQKPSEERTSVDERSRESFPASDPPATW